MPETPQKTDRQAHFESSQAQFNGLLANPIVQVNGSATLAHKEEKKTRCRQ